MGIWIRIISSSGRAARSSCPMPERTPTARRFTERGISSRWRTTRWWLMSNRNSLPRGNVWRSGRAMESITPSPMQVTLIRIETCDSFEAWRWLIRISIVVIDQIQSEKQHTLDLAVHVNGKWDANLSPRTLLSRYAGRGRGEGSRRRTSLDPANIQNPKTLTPPLPEYRERSKTPGAKFFYMANLGSPQRSLLTVCWPTSQRARRARQSP